MLLHFFINIRGLLSDRNLLQDATAANKYKIVMLTHLQSCLCVTQEKGWSTLIELDVQLRQSIELLAM